MASNESTIQMLEAYRQDAPPSMFLAGQFQSPPRNFHTSEKIEIDIVRSEEEVSIVIQDLSVGARMNSVDVFTNKEFTPPIHKEAVPLNSFDLLKRMPGESQNLSPDIRANAVVRILEGARKIEAKIRRSMELQASQVLQEGVVTLTDNAGVALYTIDYKPKATHFFTAGTAWNASGDVIGDMLTACNLVRSDGLAEPDMAMFGEGAFEAFLKNVDVINRADNRRFELVFIRPGETVVKPETAGRGGTFQGQIRLGDFALNLWTYPGRYTHPVTGVSTKFIEDANCIIRDSTARMDATFGAIPNLNPLFGRQGILPELPNRIRNIEGGMDLFMNSWLEPNGSQIFAEVGARPLFIPTAIDTYVRIATGV